MLQRQRAPPADGGVGGGKKEAKSGEDRISSIEVRGVCK